MSEVADPVVFSSSQVRVAPVPILILIILTAYLGWLYPFTLKAFDGRQSPRYWLGLLFFYAPLVGFLAMAVLYFRKLVYPDRIILSSTGWELIANEFRQAYTWEETTSIQKECIASLQHAHDMLVFCVKGRDKPIRIDPVIYDYDIDTILRSMVRAKDGELTQPFKPNPPLSYIIVLMPISLIGLGFSLRYLFHKILEGRILLERKRLVRKPPNIFLQPVTCDSIRENCTLKWSRLSWNGYFIGTG